ncbi:MAG: hypothetical protein E6J00_13540, partial [Chloroflexi bacterium]
WGAIAEVKAAVSIPVAGSGDLRTAEEAARRRRETGVDAVMLGRGILGNLWLIRQATALLVDGETVPDLDWPARVGLVRRHCELVLEYYGAERGCRLLRKFIAWGLRGFKGAPRLRQMVNAISRPEDAAAVLDQALLLDPGQIGDGLEFDDVPEACQAVA